MHKYRDNLKVTDVSHGHSVLSSVSLKKRQNPDILAQNYHLSCVETAWLSQPQPGPLCGHTFTLNLERTVKWRKDPSKPFGSWEIRPTYALGLYGSGCGAVCWSMDSLSRIMCRKETDCCSTSSRQLPIVPRQAVGLCEP